jgi:hypothetical protein
MNPSRDLCNQALWTTSVGHPMRDRVP